VFRSDGEHGRRDRGSWALFDARVEKLVHRTVDQRDQMPVVLLAVVELVHRPARARSLCSSWLFLSNPACSNCAMNGSVG
jgi:hypothetical protein